MLGLVACSCASLTSRLLYCSRPQVFHDGTQGSCSYQLLITAGFGTSHYESMKVLEASLDPRKKQELQVQCLRTKRQVLAWRRSASLTSCSVSA